MKKIVINGGRPLKGEVTINGAKNSVVALIPAIILADNVVTLDGVRFRMLIALSKSWKSWERLSSGLEIA